MAISVSCIHNTSMVGLCQFLDHDLFSFIVLTIFRFYPTNHAMTKFVRRQGRVIV